MPQRARGPPHSLSSFADGFAGTESGWKGRSSWQRRLTAEPGRVYRRLPAARIPVSPPPWAAQAGQFQLLPWALGEGQPIAHILGSWHNSLALRPNCLGGVVSGPLGSPDCVWSLHPFQPKFPSLSSRNEATAPWVAEGQRGVAWSLGIRGPKQMVAGSANSEQSPGPCAQTPSTRHGCALAVLTGSQAGWCSGESTASGARWPGLTPMSYHLPAMGFCLDIFNTRLISSNISCL